MLQAAGFGGGEMAEFPISPGRQTQVLQFSSDNANPEHFYIHVLGKARNAECEGASSCAGFDRTGADEGIGAPLDTRPRFITPFLTPHYDEEHHWLAYREYRRLLEEGKEVDEGEPEEPAVDPVRPMPTYTWNHRPEYQFSRYGLEIDAINRINTDPATGNDTSDDLYDTDTPVVGSSDDLIEVLYSLIGPEFDRLAPIDGGQDLILAVGEEETRIERGEDNTLRVDNLDHLAGLDPEDYLSMRLYLNQDAGNVLWEYAFWHMTMGVSDDSAIRGDNIVLVSADDPVVPVTANMIGYSVLDDDKKAEAPEFIQWHVVEGQATVTPATTELSDAGIATTEVSLTPNAGNKVVLEARLFGEEESGTLSEDLLVIPGKPASISLSQSGSASIKGVGEVKVDATVRDRSGNLVEDGTGVFFRENGHITLTSYEGLTRDGQVQATIVGGATAGSYPLFARSGEAEQSISVDVSSLSVALEGMPNKFAAGQTYDLVAKLSGGGGSHKDLFVDIGSDGGQIVDRDLVSDENGRTRFRFVAPREPGDYQLGIRADVNDPVLFPFSVDAQTGGGASTESYSLISGVGTASSMQVDSPVNGSVPLPVDAERDVQISGTPGVAWSLSLDDVHWANRNPVYFTRFANPRWGEQRNVSANYASLSRVSTEHPGIFGMRFSEASYWRIQLDKLNALGNPAFNFWFKAEDDGNVLSVGDEGLTLTYQNGELVAELRTVADPITVTLPVPTAAPWKEVSVGIQSGSLYLAVDDEIDTSALPAGYGGFAQTSLGDTSVKLGHRGSVESGNGVRGSIAGSRLYDWSAPALVQLDKTSGVLDSQGQGSAKLSLSPHAQQSRVSLAAVTVGMNDSTVGRSAVNVLSDQALQGFAGTYLDTLGDTSTSANDLIADVLAAQVFPEPGNGAVGMAQRFAVKPADQAAKKNVMANMAWFTSQPRYQALADRIRTMQGFFAEDGREDLAIYATEYLQEAVIQAGNGNDMWATTMVTGMTVWAELESHRPDLADLVAQAIQNRKDFWTWMRVLSLPANGWVTDVIPVPRPQMTCDKVPPDVNAGTPLAFSAKPCRATAQQMAVFLETFLDVAPEIKNDPEYINYYVATLLQSLKTLPLEYKKLFTPIGPLAGANESHWSGVETAHAALPVYALRGLLVVIKQGLRKGAGAAPGNIVALLQGGTTSRFGPEEILGSIAYLTSRLQDSPACDEYCLEEQVSKTVVQDMAAWFAAIGFANKGVVNEKDIDRKACAIAGNGHGKANELVTTAAYHSLYEFGSQAGLDNPGRYEILLSDPRASEDIIKVGLMTRNATGDTVPYDGAPHQRKPDLVLAGDGLGERIWVETKSWRYDTAKNKRKYLNSDNRTLNGGIFRNWDGVRKTKSYTMAAQKQYFLDYAATRPNLKMDFWEQQPFEEFKPSEHVTWFQVWKNEKRTWKVLERHGNSYRLSKKKTATRSVANSWIDQSGIVRKTTPQFRALQRFLARAPRGMQSDAFRTSIGYPENQHDERHANGQIANNFSEIASSTIRPFNLQTFYAIEAGEGAVDTMTSAVIDQFGGGEFAQIQKKIASGEFDEADIDELREKIVEEVESLLGPLELLLVDVPGLSWLENKIADAILGDSVESARKTVAELEIPYGSVVLENFCEKP
ncbi:COG1470 family protein [Tamilnaduibacter salinus]|uniref:COG1470 family protein n=1 Tax=Tamilnaduibacter salinus TaxID=1484056 RepID=UPI00117DF126|nr:hypothetical protein [Tamilnaduibacter salinus]